MRWFIISSASLLFFSSLAQAQIQEPPLLPEFFAVAKIQEFIQTDTSTTVRHPIFPFNFAAFYEELLSETVTLVSLHTGAGAPISSLTRFPVDVQWQFFQIYGTKAAMDAAFPNTTYQLRITSSLTGNSPFPVPLNFGSTDNYFEVPKSSNTGIINGVLRFNFNQDFTLNWNPNIGFANGTDRLFIIVQERLANGSLFEVLNFETDVYQNSFFVPGGTLNPANTYESELSFVRVAGGIDFSVTGHVGAAVFATRTHLDLIHVSEVLPIPDALDINSLSWITGGGADWFGQTTTTFDGVDAAQSGFI